MASNSNSLSEYRRLQQERWAQQERQKEEQLRKQKEAELREEQERLEKLQRDEELARKIEEEMLREEREAQEKAEALARQLQQEEDEEIARRLQHEQDEDVGTAEPSYNHPSSFNNSSQSSRPIFEELSDDEEHTATHGEQETLPDPYVDRLIDDDEAMNDYYPQQQSMTFSTPSRNTVMNNTSASPFSHFQQQAASRSISRVIRNGMVEETITETIPGTNGQVRTTTRTYPVQQQQSQGTRNDDSRLATGFSEAQDSFFADDFNSNDSFFGMNSMLNRMRQRMRGFPSF